VTSLLQESSLLTYLFMIRQFFTHVIFEKAKFSHLITNTSESSNFKKFCGNISWFGVCLRTRLFLACFANVRVSLRCHCTSYTI